MDLDVGDEALVLILSPCTLIGVSLLAARRPAHDEGREERTGV